MTALREGIVHHLNALPRPVHTHVSVQVVSVDPETGKELLGQFVQAETPLEARLILDYYDGLPDEEQFA